MKLIADAPTKQYLVHAMQIFVTCVKYSPRNTLEVKRRHFFMLLSAILAGKSEVFSADLLVLLFDVCTRDDGGGFEKSVIVNNTAFRHLILDYNMWRKVDPELVCCVLINVGQLITQSMHSTTNVAALRSMDAIDKLLHIALDKTSHHRLVQYSCLLIGLFAAIFFCFNSFIDIFARFDNDDSTYSKQATSCGLIRSCWMCTS